MALDLDERLRQSNARFVASINRILERVRAALARRPGRWAGAVGWGSIRRPKAGAGAVGKRCHLHGRVPRGLQAAAALPRSCLSQERSPLTVSLAEMVSGVAWPGLASLVRPSDRLWKAAKQRGPLPTSP